MVHCLCVSTCGRASASRRTLLNHEKICKTCRRAVKYRCGKCGKLFSSITYLKQHEMVHSDVRDFKSGLCDKSFKFKGHLKQHGLVHSKERNFKCGICDKAFAQVGNRNVHELIHLGVKNYKCVKCDKPFAHYYNTLRHEKICCKNATPVSDCSSVSGESDMTDIEVGEDEKI